MLNQVFSLSGWTLNIGPLNLTFSLSGIVEIIIFAVLSYFVIVWVKRTNAWNLLKGAAVLLLIYLAAKFLGLNNLAFVFENFFGSLLLAFIIILQPEIRRALEQLGNQSVLKNLLKNKSEDRVLTADEVENIAKALVSLGKRKVGALVVLENEISLDEYIGTGIALDAKISEALLIQIFEHNTPLHDGAVIIRNHRIVAATCYLPLSQNSEISKELGTRHRAAVGISEVSDCVSLTASEETGQVSIAMGGNLTRGINEYDIRNMLLNSEEKKPEKKEFRLDFLDKMKERVRHER